MLMNNKSFVLAAKRTFHLTISINPDKTDYCLTDPSTSCTMKSGHQCMPGNPDSMGDVLTHAICVGVDL